MEAYAIQEFLSKMKMNKLQQQETTPNQLEDELENANNVNLMWEMMSLLQKAHQTIQQKDQRIQLQQQQIAQLEMKLKKKTAKSQLSNGHEKKKKIIRPPMNTFTQQSPSSTEHVASASAKFSENAPVAVIKSVLYKHLFFTSGIHYWEVLINRNSSGNLVIGVGCRGFEKENLNPITCWNEQGAIGYWCKGSLVKQGGCVAKVEPFGGGDVIGIFLNMNIPDIRFFRNGIEQKGLHGTSSKWIPHSLFAAASYCPHVDECTLITNPPYRSFLSQ